LFEIVIGIAKCVDLKFAAIARSGINFAQRETAAKPPPHGTIERCGHFCHRTRIERWRGFRQRRGNHALEEMFAHREALEIVT
jgi:hypothetical protein